MPNGVVSKTSGKPWKDTQTGEDMILYSLQLTGDKTWYRTGTNDPASVGAGEGANVIFDLNPKGNVLFKTLRVIKGSGDAPVARAPTPVATSSTAKNDYWDKKEARDIAKDARYQDVDIPRMTYCGAQDTAVKVVELALAQGALDLGTAKKSGKLDILVEAVNKVADDLFRKRINAPTMTELNQEEDDEEKPVAGTSGSPDDDE